jgi:predicted amidophosphoribosyltransferase
MTKHCNACNKDYESTVSKCPHCGKKLREHYTEEGLAQIQKENDDSAVASMMLL